MFAITVDDDNSTATDGTHDTIAAATVTLPGRTLGTNTTMCPIMKGAMAQFAADQTAMMNHIAA